MPDLPLTGLSVLVTRPRGQGQVLLQALRAAGANAIDVPVLEIVPVEAAMPAAGLGNIEAAVFVSANAVHYGVPLLRRAGDLPANTAIFAIGLATAAALRAAGYANVVSPQQKIDSEGLLAMPQLRAVAGKHIILVKGRSDAGGRKVLETGLAARGAELIILECYERNATTPEPVALAAAAECLGGSGVAMVMALSVETLDALLSQFSYMAERLRSAWVLVPHPRVAQAARDRGFSNVMEVPMSAEALVPALITWSARNRARHD